MLCISGQFQVRYNPNGVIMNFLNAVFWDYPRFTDPEYLQNVIRENAEKRMWILKRFLERGRVVDTWKYFTMPEIAENIPDLQLRPHALKKWKRMIDV